MTCITIVDDSHVDRMLIAGLLKTRPDFHVGFAENGKDALDKIVDAPPHLVITDLIMPVMDGFELVRQMGQRFPDIPVILMTAYGNETIAVKALEAGAASYVPKAQQAERLLETVQRVLARADAERRRARLAECVTEFHCTFLLDDDAELIPPLIDDIQQRLVGIGIKSPNERVRTAVALEEALRNAMLRGPAATGESAEPGSLAARDRRAGELKRGNGRRQPLRRIGLQAHITSHGARFVIRDEEGFDRAAMSTIADGDCFESGKNRELMLMRSLMDEVAYNDLGNELTLIKRVHNGPSHERRRHA